MNTSQSQPAPRPLRFGVTPVYQRTQACDREIVVNLGGARSSKSVSTAQRLIERFRNIPGREILVTRKYGPALTRTAERLVIDLLTAQGIYHRLNHNKSEGTIIHPQINSRFNFFSIDQPSKIKSTEYNDVWMEEADEFTWEDFGVVRTRMSAPESPGHPNQIFLSLNPADELGWANQKIILNPAFKGKFGLILSTWRDNPFLGEAYIQILEDLKQQDPVAYQVYAKGEWGTLTNVIYAPFEVIDELPKEFDEVIYGLDFGFNNQSALDRIGIKDGTNVYHDEKIYETGLTNSDLIKRVEALIPTSERHCPIYCDAAEPDRIAEFERAGFNVFPADKSVKDGIDFCKRLHHYTTAANVNLNKERGSYKWKSDRNGNVLDEPVKFMDHLMDADRYALYTHNKGRFDMPGIFVG